MKKYIYTFLTSSSILLANTSSDIENDFLTSLDEVSEIATKTKLNIDDTPSFVTVLYSNRLQKLGINNVFEALGLVSGVQLKKENFGVPVVVFRGATQKGEVKLMIDGVEVINNYRDSIYYYLDLPIELIDRIEVIRGSGSVLYGSGAMSGVVNIITHSSQKKNTNKVFISTGSYNSYKAGAVTSYKLDNATINLDGYYHTDNKSIQSNNLQSDQHLDSYSFGFNIASENLSFNNRIKSADFGNSHGFFNVMDTDKDKYHNLNKSIFSELKYSNNINKNNSYTVSIGYQNYYQHAVDVKVNTDIDTIFKEQTYFSNAQLISKSIKNNTLLIGAEFSSSEILTNDFLYGTTYKNDYTVNHDATREIFSIFLNDTYVVRDDFDVTFGLRYSRYKDENSHYKPSMGFVYRANEQLRFKATYAESFRAPSWLENKVHPEFVEEKAKTTEFGIIYRYNTTNNFKINFYKTNIKDVITQNGLIFNQSGENNMDGVEVEYSYIYDNQNEFKVSSSYVNATDENNNNISDVSNILANVTYSHDFNHGFNISSLLKYQSDAKRSATDTREDMDSSLIYDQSISYIKENLTLSLTIKDLFDAGKSYPLPANTYLNDYQDAGRSVFAKASWNF